MIKIKKTNGGINRINTVEERINELIQLTISYRM